jgi:hypothetical protein
MKAALPFITVTPRRQHLIATGSHRDTIHDDLPDLDIHGAVSGRPRSALRSRQVNTV